MSGPKKTAIVACVSETLESRRLLSGTLFITQGSSAMGNAGIAEYSESGTAINPSLASLGTDAYPFGIASNGADIFVADYYTRTIGEYTTAGKTVNAKLITSGFASGTGPFGLALSGNDLYVAVGNGGSRTANGSIIEYTLSSTPGKVVSHHTVVKGLDDAGSVAISGTDLFVTDYALGTISKFSTSGATIANPLIDNIALPEQVVAVGSDLFVTENSGDCIGEFSTSGAAINPFLVSGLQGPWGLAASGSDLFVNANATIGEYTLDGSVVNPSLITGLVNPQGLVYVPASSATGTATQLAFSTQPATVTAGTLLSKAFSVAVEDSTGAVVTTNKTHVTLTLTGGPAGAKIGTKYTATALHGIATFSSVRLKIAGSYSFQATDGSLTEATSTPITVVAAAPSKLVIVSTAPITQTAGLASETPLMVEVVDAFGNTVTADASTITLTTSTKPKALKTTGTFTAFATEGVASFTSLALTVAGKYRFHATDGIIRSAATPVITVDPAVAAKLAFDKQTTKAVAGKAIHPATSVWVEDTYGNVETADSSVVTLGIDTPAGGVLSGAVNVVASKGLASFSDAVITTAGSVTLSASEPGLIGVISNPITVAPGAPASVVIGQQPTTAAVSAAASPAFIVNVVDSYGNLCTNHSATVALSVLSGPGGGKITGKVKLAAVKGVATFSDVLFSTAGQYTIKAASGKLTASTSALVNVSPSAA